MHRFLLLKYRESQLKTTVGEYGGFDRRSIDTTGAFLQQRIIALDSSFIVHNERRISADIPPTAYNNPFSIFLGVNEFTCDPNPHSR
jgi:hypothetical protein